MRFDRLFSLDWETLAEQMSDLPKADARHLSSFFDHLLSDVVCQQLLPEAAKSFSRAFSISFSFKPRIAVNRDLSGCRADIAVDISHPMFPDAYLTYESGSPFSQLKMAGFGCMPSDLHRRCMLQLSVMQDIFSSRNHEWRLGIYYGVLKPECPLAVYNKMLPKTSFWFRLKSFSCLEDLLASLLSDGYDLATLQPFLAG